MLCGTKPAISYRVIGFVSKVVDRGKMAIRFSDSNASCFFLAQKDMIRVARFLAIGRIAVPPGADPVHDQIADQDKDDYCHDIQQFCFLCHRILECRELFLISGITVWQ